MAKLVYVGFPSPLAGVSCKNLETGESVEVVKEARGICQEISTVPEKKGKYRLELDFEFDPSVLSNISNLKISNDTPQQSAPISENTPVTELLSGIPGLDVKKNDDGSVSFTMPSEDGGTTEVNANIPGLDVVKNDDGTVTFSMPRKTTTTTTTHVSQPVRTTKTTTTTITKTSVPTTTQTTVAQFQIPSQQNINIKLPCPQKFHSIVKTACSDPKGAPVPVNVSVVDDNTINLEFSPKGGNGTYSLEIMLGDTPFPGSPIQLEVKGL